MTQVGVLTASLLASQGFSLGESLRASNDIKEVARHGSILLVVIPTPFVGRTVRLMGRAEGRAFWPCPIEKSVQLAAECQTSPPCRFRKSPMLVLMMPSWSAAPRVSALLTSTVDVLCMHSTTCSRHHAYQVF